MAETAVMPPFAGLPSIPAIEELKKHRQWVAWKYEFRNGPDSKPTKPPISPRTGFGASHSKPETWGTYQDAFERARRSNLPGVGFVLADGDEICGIDLDACRDPDTGKIEPWAAEIVALAETYAEVSPSGEGIRLFARGKPEKTIKADKAHVEIYGKLRYLTVTGQHVEGTPDEIRPAPQSMKALVARVEAVKQEKKPETDIPVSPPDSHDGSDFFERVNAAALANLSSWVPSIFPGAKFQQSTGAYRVPSRDLGRDLEEDLSIAPNGIVDFGVHDMGDARDGKRSAVDLAMEYGRGKDAKSAAFWLCDRLGRSPDVFGWEEMPPILPNIEEIIRAVYESHERKRGVMIDATGRGHLIVMATDQPYEPPEELVRDTIPARGVGFLGGQSGAFKSFTAVELAFCIGTGAPFAGRKVERPGAVLYCAFEGAGTIAGRVTARRSRLENASDEVPFMMLDKFGPVVSNTDFKALGDAIERARVTAEAEWGAPLSAVIVDTVAAAGMIPDDRENDPAAWQRIFDRLNPISAMIDAPIILVHHYGKAASAGLRGSSNARAGADFVLAMTCDRDEVTGDTSNHYLALTKSRTAPEGGIAAVKPVEVEIGTRKDGTPVKGLVLDFDVGTKLKTAKRPTKALQSFMAAFDEALASEGESVRIRNEANAPQVRAVRLAHIRDEFEKRYVTGSTDDQKRADTLRKQFKNALDQIPPTIIVGTWDGIEWAWRLTAGGRSKSDAE